MPRATHAIACIRDLFTDKQTVVPSGTLRDSEQLRCMCLAPDLDASPVFDVHPAIKPTMCLSATQSQIGGRIDRTFPGEVTCALNTFWAVRTSPHIEFLNGSG